MLQEFQFPQLQTLLHRSSLPPFAGDGVILRAGALGIRTSYF